MKSFYVVNGPLKGMSVGLTVTKAFKDRGSIVVLTSHDTEEIPNLENPKEPSFKLTTYTTRYKAVKRNGKRILKKVPM